MMCTEIEPRRIQFHINKIAESTQKDCPMVWEFISKHLSKLWQANDNHLWVGNGFFQLFKRNFLFRIFRMVADLNSGVIFSLFPANIIFFALTAYNTEHVRLKSSCCSTSRWFCFHKLRNSHNLSWFLLILLPFLVYFWYAYDWISHRCNVFIINLAVSFLLLCHFHHQSNFICGRYRLQYKLVWLSTGTTETFHFNHCPISGGCSFHWLQFGSMHSGSFRQGMNLIEVDNYYYLLNSIFSCWRPLALTIWYSEASRSAEQLWTLDFYISIFKKNSWFFQKVQW